MPPSSVSEVGIVSLYIGPQNNLCKSIVFSEMGLRAVQMSVSISILTYFFFNKVLTAISIKFDLYHSQPHFKTRCVCKTLMPPKYLSFEKHDPDI